VSWTWLETIWLTYTFGKIPPLDCLGVKKGIWPIEIVASTTTIFILAYTNSWFNNKNTFLGEPTHLLLHLNKDVKPKQTGNIGVIGFWRVCEVAYVDSIKLNKYLGSVDYGVQFFFKLMITFVQLLFVVCYSVLMFTLNTSITIIGR